MKKALTAFLALALILASSLTVSAAATVKALRIYGNDDTGAAFNQSSWEEFYKPSYFVWFQIDLDIASDMTTSLNNPQANGDADLKPSSNDLIKLNGRTIKQWNDTMNDAYGAMVAFEPNKDGKLRLAIWLSSVRGELFNPERYKYFSIELLPGFKVPDLGYEPGNGKVAEVIPTMFRISIEDLEYKNNPNSSGYAASKSEWLKPMLEDLKGKWEEVDPAQNKEEPAVSSAPPASSAPAVSSEAPAVSSTEPEPESTVSAETPPSVSSVAEAPVKGNVSNLLAILSIAMGGVILLCTGVVYFVMRKQLRGNPDAVSGSEPGSDTND